MTSLESNLNINHPSRLVFRLRRLRDHPRPARVDDLREVEQEEVAAGGEDPERGHGAEWITGAEEENIEKHE